MVVRWQERTCSANGLATLSQRTLIIKVEVETFSILNRGLFAKQSKEYKEKVLSSSN